MHHRECPAREPAARATLQVSSADQLPQGKKSPSSPPSSVKSRCAPNPSTLTQYHRRNKLCRAIVCSSTRLLLPRRANANLALKRLALKLGPLGFLLRRQHRQQLLIGALAQIIHFLARLIIRRLPWRKQLAHGRPGFLIDRPDLLLLIVGDIQRLDRLWIGKSGRPTLLKSDLPQPLVLLGTQQLGNRLAVLFIERLHLALALALVGLKDFLHFFAR